jgi:ribosomal protein S4E
LRRLALAAREQRRVKKRNSQSHGGDVIPERVQSEKGKMKSTDSGKLKDGAQCKVIGGTHEGKCGTVRDIKTGKSGYVSITVVQANGERFKTLAKNVLIEK